MRQDGFYCTQRTAGLAVEIICYWCHSGHYFLILIASKRGWQASSLITSTEIKQRNVDHIHFFVDWVTNNSDILMWVPQILSLLKLLWLQVFFKIIIVMINWSLSHFLQRLITRTQLFEFSSVRCLDFFPRNSRINFTAQFVQCFSSTLQNTCKPFNHHFCNSGSVKNSGNCTWHKKWDCKSRSQSSPLRLIYFFSSSRLLFGYLL